MKLTKQKAKFTIILAVEFIAVAILLILVFFAGKKSYDVTFDVNGGTLISGSLTQRVTQGQSANPPSVVKEGHYLLGWSGSYKGVTSDRTLKAIWEYETTPGITYSDPENQNFCEITGAFSEINGDVYIGAYHNNIKVLGINDSAFEGLSKIKSIYLLDGILKIGNRAFAECTSLQKIDFPSTVQRLGDYAFYNCESLKEITLPDGLEYIGAYTFYGCRSLEKITIPSTVKYINSSAFENCTSLKEIVFASREETVKVESSNGSGSAIGEFFGKDEEIPPTIVEIKSETQIIGEYAFAGCTSLESVTVPENVTQILKGAFEGCLSLSEVILPLSVKVIKDSAFTTPDTAFYAYVSEDKIPEGWEDGWCHEDSEIIYGYTGIEDETDSEGESETETE